MWKVLKWLRPSAAGGVLHAHARGGGKPSALKVRYAVQVYTAKNQQLSSVLSAG